MASLPSAAPVARAPERALAIAAADVATPSENRPTEEFESVAESPGDVVSEGADAANVWPDERSEAAFISETRGRGEPVPVASAEVIEEAAAKPLPPLDEMVKRIPAGTRELLDELFRAKFTTVRRVKKADLKN